jgi:DNA-binding NarL/FixJ family response regulator
MEEIIMYVHHLPETKSLAIELRSTGKSVAAISKELSISESTLRLRFKRLLANARLEKEKFSTDC